MWFFKKNRARRKAAENLYTVLVAMARSPWLYEKACVPDTLDGRFDCLSLHLALLMRRLKDEQGEAKYIAQSLSDIFIQDMDRSVREMGVGDMGVGRHVKNMTQALYGRMIAYEQALLSDDVDNALYEALVRNIFRGEAPADCDLSPLVGYVREKNDAIMKMDVLDLLDGQLS